MLLSIPVIDDTNIDHYATTWIISYNPDRTSPILTIDKSETYLNVLDHDLLIPNGEIWYVSALYHLKDSNGNEIENDSWLGPTPLVSEETMNNNNIIIPTVFINKPAVTIDYDYNNVITLNIKKPITNGNYENTILYFYKYSVNYGKYVANKFESIKLLNTNNTLTYTVSELGLTDASDILIEVIHMTEDGTVSDPFIVKPSKYGDNITIEPGLENLDAYKSDLIIDIKPKSDLYKIGNINLVIYDTNKKFIVQVSGSDGELDLTGKLKPNDQYLGYLTYDLIKNDVGVMHSITTPITTKKIIFNDYRKDNLNYTLEYVRDINIPEWYINVSEDILGNILYPINEDKWNSITYDPTDKSLKDTGKVLIDNTIGTGTNLRWITKKKAVYITHKHSDDSFHIGVIELNIVNNTYEVKLDVTINPSSYVAKSNKIVKLGDNVYVFYVEDSKVKYMYLNVNTLDYSIFDTNIAATSDVTVEHLSNSNVLLAFNHDTVLINFNIKTKTYFTVNNFEDTYKDSIKTAMKLEDNIIAYLLLENDGVGNIIKYDINTNTISTVNNDLDITKINNIFYTKAKDAIIVGNDGNNIKEFILR